MDEQCSGEHPQQQKTEIGREGAGKNEADHQSWVKPTKLKEFS